jgi:Domain of unknown function (DUF4234)
MAQEVRIAGSEGTAKIRNLFAVALLPFITFLIYYFYWWYQVNRELKDYGRAKGTDELGNSPGTSLLAVTLGALIIIPALVSNYRGFKRVQAAQRLTGVEPINGWIGLILFVVISPAFWAYVQSGMNSVWQRQESAEAVEQPA